MIICNGTYTIERHTGGGEDEFGRPLETIAEFGRPLPCRITTNTDTQRGAYEDGKFRNAEFMVLIDGITFPACNRIKLNRLGEELGEYDVVRVEPLEAVNATKIIVAK